MRPVPRSRGQTGFTLIELMLVIMVMGILSALLLPMVKLDTARVKISEVIMASSTCRTLISEIYQLDGSSPGADNWGCEQSGGAAKYVDAVRTTGEGIILVDIKGMGDLRLDFHTVTLAPLNSMGQIVDEGEIVRRWRCGSSVDGTDLDPKFLPSSCRG